MVRPATYILPEPNIATLLAQRILVLDGAMGTMIQCHDLDEAEFRGARFADWDRDLKGNNDLLTLTRPEIITEVAETFGSQCMVLSIDAKRNGKDGWEAYRDGGREHADLDAVEWAVRGQELGAGEILLTSVDREGTRKGFDLELVQAVSDSVSIPVIASGGMGGLNDLVDVIRDGHADAVAMAHVLHYETLTLPDIREHALAEDLPVRNL